MIHHHPPGPGLSMTSNRLSVFSEQLGLTNLDLMTIEDLLRHAKKTDDTGLAVVLLLMFAALSEGSLCLILGRQSLIRVIGKDTGTDMDFRDEIIQFLSRLDQGEYDHLIDRNANDDFKPLVLDYRSGRRLLYFQKFHYHEKRLKQRLKMMLAPREKEPPVDGQTIGQVIDRLYQEKRVIRKGAGAAPIHKDKDQINAIRAALTHSLIVISGGPGTGKTSLLANILRALVQTGTDPARILLAAPTGRAAQRMTESLHANLASIARLDADEQRLGRLIGSTLHKLLIYQRRRGGFSYNERHRLPADVIAVDEVSMVDVVMMDHLFQAVDPLHTRVILIGDKDQLPSVEAGSVLADISTATHPGMADHLVVLQRVFRSAGKLLELARSINAGESIDLQSTGFSEAIAQPAGNWSFVTATDTQRLNRHLDRWTWHHFFLPPDDQLFSYVDGVTRLTALTADDKGYGEKINRLFGFIQRCRILTVVRHGQTGMRWINNRIANALKSQLDPDAGLQNQLFNGALIMITRNDYDRQLFNGDVGMVLGQPGGGGYRAWFRRVNGVASFPVSGLTDWELAFAMTVHKSQGSEFDDTLLVLPEDSNHRLLTREIIYTAATRAAKRLIIYGSKDAFQTALRRKIHRQSGL